MYTTSALWRREISRLNTQPASFPSQRFPVALTGDKTWFGAGVARYAFTVETFTPYNLPVLIGASYTFTPLLTAIIEQAIAGHPRDVLHVAEMSAKGHSLVCKLLHLSPGEPGPLRELEGTEDTHEFRIYVKSVANDPKDPLSTLARGLLKKPTRRCQ